MNWFFYPGPVNRALTVWILHSVCVCKLSPVWPEYHLHACTGPRASDAADDSWVSWCSWGGRDFCDRRPDSDQPLDHRGRSGFSGLPAQWVHHVSQFNSGWPHCFFMSFCDEVFRVIVTVFFVFVLLAILCFFALQNVSKYTQMQFTSHTNPNYHVLSIVDVIPLCSPQPTSQVSLWCRVGHLWCEANTIHILINCHLSDALKIHDMIHAPIMTQCDSTPCNLIWWDDAKRWEGKPRNY